MGEVAPISHRPELMTWKLDALDNTYRDRHSIRRMHDAEGAASRAKRKERCRLSVRPDDTCPIGFVSGGDHTGGRKGLGCHDAISKENMFTCWRMK